MKVTLDRTFPMPAGSEATWATLADIEGVASCMPGAKITERVDDRHYKGTVAVKMGPAQLTFRGEIEVSQQDAASRTLRLVAKGTDMSGTSAASLDLTARVEDADGGRSNLVGHAEATVSGKAATFGGRLMQGVADQILKQFAANFAARVEASASVTQPSPVPPGATNAPAPQASANANATPAPAAEAAATPAKPLNAFALLWAMLRDWVRGLFTRKTA